MAKRSFKAWQIFQMAKAEMSPVPGIIFRLLKSIA